MASIYQRRLKSGVFWYASLQTKEKKWINYNTKIPVAGEKNETWAIKAANELQRAMDRGDDIFGDAVKKLRGEEFETLKEKYLTEKMNQWSPRTLEMRAYTYRLYFELCGGGSIYDITKERVTKFSRLLEARGASNTGAKKVLSKHSLNIHLRNLRALLLWCEEELENFKAPKIREVKAPGSAHRDYYTADECKKILEAAKGIVHGGRPFHYFLAILLLTGMRRGEALQMKWEWILWDAKQILLPAMFVKTNVKRVVPINGPLEQYLRQFPPEKKGRLFNYSVASGRYADVYRRVIKRAGVRYLKLHNLRDTFIVNCILAGIDIYTISTMVGATVKTIQNHYAALGIEEVGRVMARVDQSDYFTAIQPSL